MNKLKGIQNANLTGRIFLRLDLDVPLSEEGIEDDSRLKAGLETIDFLLKTAEKVIIVGHLGRPTRQEKEKFSLEKVANWFANNYSSSLSKEKIGDFEGWKIKEKLYLLENIRFFEEEEKNDLEFSKKLSFLADFYVNDAFAVSHRKHASIVGVASLLPHFAGLHLEKEMSVLSSVLDNPKRPLVFIIGGAKIETKLPLVKKMSSFADTLIVGGLISKELKTLLAEKKEDLSQSKAKIIVADLTEDTKDITEESALKIKEETKGQTVVWNGVFGLIEEGHERGTKAVAQAIVDLGAYSIVGGGDTVGYLQKIGLLNKFTFASTGGGAMLEFLSGEKLPGIEVLLT